MDMADNCSKSYKDKLLNQDTMIPLTSGYSMAMEEGDILVKMEPTGPSVMLSDKLRNKDDLERAMLGGPWIVIGHYLMMEQWTPYFHTSTADLKSVVEWFLSFSLRVSANGFSMKGCRMCASSVVELAIARSAVLIRNRRIMKLKVWQRIKIEDLVMKGVQNMIKRGRRNTVNDGLGIRKVKKRSREGRKENFWEDPA
ncbi:conserved hypothetical protein [Ricinus communis]|uniref:DUF4283 domain-containing protein n=1 Tax=Ricinus communis TaxID=3988 RepID=B9T2J1_RICCO|nr:conserved hypothetical protein [Ricinus communis]